MTSRSNKGNNDNKIKQYVLDELLVEHSVSAIYRARHEKTDQPVFLVTLQADAAKSGDLADRFQRRAETLAQLEDETFLPLLDFGTVGKRPFAVMAYVPGQFLAERLESAEKPRDKTQIIAALTLVRQLSQILTVAHPSGLIHHDLRPKNIFVNEAGQPFLLDLVVPPTSSVSQYSDTPPSELDYDSPEQLSGKALSGRSNIFSLGVLLYRLLAGHKPALPVSEWDIFEHQGVAREIPLNSVRTDLTEATYATVRDCLWQREWSRFETVTALTKSIDRAIKKESAPGPPPLPAWRQFLNRLLQPKARKYVVPAVILLFLLLFLFLLMRGRANRQGSVTTTPDTAVLQVEADTAIPSPTDNAISNEPTLTPTEAQLTVDEAIVPAELEVVPTFTATASPTARATAVNTAVSTLTPTVVQTFAPIPVQTATSTATIPPSETPANTPAPAPTEVGCIISPPFGWVRYEIQPNDSLSALSQATNTTVERLLEVNCLDTILLSVGQNIWLPFNPLPTATETQPGPTLPAGTAVSPTPGNNPTPNPGPPTPTAPPAPASLP